MVTNNVDLITDSMGGNGVLRDVADMILDAQGLLDKVVNKYIKKGM